MGKHTFIYIWFSNRLFDSLICILKEEKTFENVTWWKEKDWERVRHCKNHEEYKKCQDINEKFTLKSWC